MSSRLVALVELQWTSEMVQQLGWDRLAIENTGRDRIRDRHLAALPSRERFSNRHERPSQFFLVRGSRMLAEQVFDALRRLRHTLSTLSLSGACSATAEA
jgi:hypothetical protein